MFEKLTAMLIAVFVAIGGNVPQSETSGERWLSIPVIDGSDSTVELEAAFISGYSGYPYDKILVDTFHTGLENSFERLYSGTADIIIAPFYDRNRIEEAKKRGIELFYEPIASKMNYQNKYNYMESGLTYYCIYFDGNTEKPNVINFVDYMLSVQGQATVSRAGFEPIFDLKYPAFAKPLYTAKGTGEPRPEDFAKSEKYSAVIFYRSNYSAPPEYDKIELFLLDNDLRNAELENKINEWIISEITNKNLTEKYRDCVVYFEAINGYMEVVISQTYGEGGSYLPDSPVSVWNLKTGERVTHFSDLFYEGSDFLPALKNAYKVVYPNRYTAEIQKEPDRFFITDFLYGDDSYNYISDEYGGETVEDEYKLPINFLSSVMDLSPVWTYCDVTPYFTTKHFDNDQHRRIRDHELPEFGAKAIMYNDNFREWEIVSSRFLTKIEIKLCNIELNKLYDFVEQSAEYKSYKPEYEWQYPLNSTVSFSKNSEITAVSTPFGDFIRNRKTGEMKGPGDDIRLSGKERFVGSVDVDFDGDFEWISIYKGINIYDENLELIAKYPVNSFRDYADIRLWKVIKGKNDNNTTGFIYYDDNRDYGTIKYEIIDGKIKFIENKLNVQKTEEVMPNSLGESSVCYTGLGMNLPDLFSSDYGESIQNLQKEINRGEELIPDSPNGFGLYTVIDFGDGHNAMFMTENYYFDGEDITSESDYFDGYDHTSVEYYAQGIYVTTIGDTVLITMDDMGLRSRCFVMQYTDGKLFESPISYLTMDQINITDNEFTLTVMDNDEYTHGEWLISKLPFGPFKDYWFFVSNGEIFEYGGIDYPTEEFKKLSGGERIISEIEKDGGVITNILYRENNIININYDKIYDDKPDLIYHFNKTYKLYISYSGNKTITRLEAIDTDGRGIYHASYSDYSGEDIATYPPRLPKIGG
jgi:hypothetical protein